MSGERKPLLPGLGLEAARDRVFSFIRKMHDENRLHVLAADGDLPKDMRIICVRAADFDPSENAIWRNPENHSQPRPVNCGGCGQQVVMSNTMWKTYLMRGGAQDHVRCSVCGFAELTARTP